MRRELNFSHPGPNIPESSMFCGACSPGKCYVAFVLHQNQSIGIPEVIRACVRFRNRLSVN
jgi:hypothetical protein